MTLFIFTQKALNHFFMVRLSRLSTDTHACLHGLTCVSPWRHMRVTADKRQKTKEKRHLYAA